MPSVTVVIPARYGSTRLPGKPLIDLHGKTMIQRVVERALTSEASRVIVATDDARIAKAVNSEGVMVAMTAASHQSGTDRVQEAIANLGLNDEDVVVNVQGDEPLIPPEVIDQAATLLQQHADCGVSTLYEPISDFADVFNPNIVKVVTDNKGHALYFSRAPIPWERGRFDGGAPSGEARGWLRHLGIYAFKYWALAEFVSLAPSRLEKLESLEQLRFLENGISIAIDRSCREIPAGIDTASDVERVRNYLRTLETA